MPASRHRRPRRDADVRLGYAGLGVGAVGFLLVLVGTLVVIEVAPRVDLPQPFAARGQSVVRYPALEAVSSVDRDPLPAGAPATTRRTAAGAPSTATATPTPDVPGDPGDAGDPRGDGGSGGGTGGGTTVRPGTATVEGPLSQAVDPVTGGLVDALDGTTGGATAPLTGPAGGVLDEVTDLGDALLPRP